MYWHKSIDITQKMQVEEGHVTASKQTLSKGQCLTWIKKVEIL